MRSSRGAALMAVGSAISGVLAYVFMAQVTRAVGAEAAAPVSVLWTYWSFAAAALTFPLQHWIVRTVAAADGLEGGVRRALPTIPLVAGGTALVAAGAAWLGRDALFGGPGWSFPLLVLLVTLGSAFVGVVRGVLTARRRFGAVAVALVAENGVRCVLAGVLMATDAGDARTYGVALVAGQLVGLVWPAALRLAVTGPEQPWLRFVSGVAGGQLVGQGVLVGGPIVLALLGGSPTEVTGLFTALALFRAPYTLALGAVSPVTGILTRMVVSGRGSMLRLIRTAIAGTTVVGAVLGAGFGAWAGPWLLRLVFGSTVEVSSTVASLTAAGSVVALGTLSLSLLVMARERPHALVWSWGAGLAAAAVLLVVGPGAAVTTVSLAFVVAQSTAFVAMVASDARAGSSRLTRARPPAPPR